ncbi:MAG: protein kinase domain-containing protein, partial [Planctomycetota bacterium]
MPHPDIDKENQEILRIGVVERILNQDTLAKAAQRMSREKRQPIGAFLLAEGHCTREEFERIVRVLGAKILFCPRCRQFSTVENPSESSACHTCNAPLVWPEFPSTEEKGMDPAFQDPVGSGRYQLGKEIGRGGLGRVFAAKDLVLGREVAVKEMFRGSNHPGFTLRFRREGEVAGRLMHPNIVPVFDLGISEERGETRHYFTMGRILGRDLSEILHKKKEGPGPDLKDLSRPQLLGIFQDVCLAVAYAHDQGVIHRDL